MQTIADSWRILPERYEIDSCFTTRAEHSCQSQYSPLALYIAIACNEVKFVSILLCLLVSRESVPTTVGDALDSFLTRPEPLSEGRCLLYKQDESLMQERYHVHGHQVISYPPSRRLDRAVVSRVIRETMGTLHYPLACLYHRGNHLPRQGHQKPNCVPSPCELTSRITENVILRIEKSHQAFLENYRGKLYRVPLIFTIL